MLHIQLTLLEQVNQTAGGADNEFNTLLQGFDLGLVGAATVNGGDADAAVLGSCDKVPGHLHGKFAGGHDDHGLGCARSCQLLEGFILGADNPVQGWDAEAEGFACARLGLANDVMAGQGDGERHGLDGEGVEDTGLCQRRHNLRVHAEAGERFFLFMAGRFVAAERTVNFNFFAAVFCLQDGICFNAQMLTVQFVYTRCCLPGLNAGAMMGLTEPGTTAQTERSRSRANKNVPSRRRQGGCGRS